MFVFESSAISALIIRLKRMKPSHRLFYDKNVHKCLLTTAMGHKSLKIHDPSSPGSQATKKKTSGEKWGLQKNSVRILRDVATRQACSSPYPRPLPNWACASCNLISADATRTASSHWVSLDILILLLPGIQLVTKSESRWSYLWNPYCHSWFRLSWLHKQTWSKGFLTGFRYYSIHFTHCPWLIFQKQGCKHTFS